MKFKFKKIDFVVGVLFAIIGAVTTEHVIPMLALFGMGILLSEAYRGLPPPRDEHFGKAK
jgi:hypothetical protein